MQHSLQSLVFHGILINTAQKVGHRRIADNFYSKVLQKFTPKTFQLFLYRVKEIVFTFL